MKLTASDVSFFLSCKDESDARFRVLCERVNIALCEWRGWKECMKHGSGIIGVPPSEKTWLYIPSHILGNEALGNCHDAEEGLTPNQQTEYVIILCRMLIEGNEPHASFTLLHANERYRSIALLRVVNPELFA